VVDFVPDPGLHHRHRPPRLLVAAHQHRPPRGDRRAQRTAQFEMSARPTRNAAASTAQTVSPNVCPRNVNTATLVVWERRQARSTKATGTDRGLQRPEHLSCGYHGVPDRHPRSAHACRSIVRRLGEVPDPQHPQQHRRTRADRRTRRKDDGHTARNRLLQRSSELAIKPRGLRAGCLS